MKLLTPLILIIFLFSCNGNNSLPDSNIAYPDTAITTIDADLNFMTNDYRRTTSVRIVDKKLLPDPKDSTRNTVQLDTAYYIPFFVFAKDSIGRPILDGDGTPIKNTEWRSIPRSFVMKDFDKRRPVDSIFTRRPATQLPNQK